MSVLYLVTNSLILDSWLTLVNHSNIL